MTVKDLIMQLQKLDPSWHVMANIPDEVLEDGYSRTFKPVPLVALTIDQLDTNEPTVLFILET